LSSLLRSRRARAVAISLSISLLLTPCWGEPGIGNARKIKEPAAAPQLPDVKSLIERQQLFKDVGRYRKCKTEASEIIDLQNLPPIVINPHWTNLDDQAKKLGVFPAYADARDVFLKNRSFLRKKDSFSIAIYSLLQPLKRKIFIVDLARSQITFFNIQHGRGSFQNAGPYRSSVGCFIGGVNVKDFAFNLHGIDGALNSYACERRLQVHISQVWGVFRKPSFGCLTLQRGHTEAYRAISAAASGGGLVCAYDEGRVPERR
jgi:hypothetical protein